VVRSAAVSWLALAFLDVVRTAYQKYSCPCHSDLDKTETLLVDVDLQNTRIAQHY
jgi:hypothetical protein